MKKSILFVAIGMFIASCDSNTQTQPNTVVVTQAPQPQQYQEPSNVQAQVADIPGFNVQGFADLLKSTSNPSAIQDALNSPNNSVNNLDLDNDGIIDYLRVDQINRYAIRVVDEIGEDQRVDIATLTINPQNNSYSIKGSPDYCGNTYIYNSQPGITLGQLMFLNWLMTPHPVYHPNWGYRRYPAGYTAYHSRYERPYSRSYIQERKVTKTVTRTVTQPKVSVTSPNYPSNPRTRTNTPQTSRPTVSTPPPAPRPSISAPAQSQRSFQVNTKNTGKPIPNAFAKPASNTGYKSNTTPSNSYRSPSGSSGSSSYRSPSSNSGSSSYRSPSGSSGSRSYGSSSWGKSSSSTSSSKSTSSSNSRRK